MKKKYAFFVLTLTFILFLAVGENCAAQVAVQERTITVTASGTDVAVYTVDGKALVPSHAVSGDAAYSVQAPGVYLVVAGDKLYKVAVK